MKHVAALIDFFSPPPSAALPEHDRYRGRVLVAACLAAFVLSLPFLPIRLAAEGFWNPHVLLLLPVLSVLIIAPFLYKATGSVVTAGMVLVATEVSALITYAFLDGGLYSSSAVCFPILPVFTVLFAGWRFGLSVGFVMLAGIAGILFGHHQNWLQPTVDPSLNLWLFGAALSLVIVLLMILAYAFLDWQRRIQAELIAACQSRDHFLGTVSHELRTPLNAVIGLSALLKKGNAGALSHDQAEYVRDISTSAHQLLNLVNEVLDFSRIQAGAVAIQAEPSAVAALVEAWGAAFQRECQERGIGLRIEIHDSARGRNVLLDPNRMRQAVFNLITNALKFTPKGGQVLVGAEVCEGRLKVWVADSGIGIPHGELERVFDDFYQTEHGKRSLTAGGTGLGLSITRRIVSMHGGTIRAESGGPGKGSRFVIDLPMPLAGADSAALATDVA